MQMNRQWMYNADRRSPEFMRGVHDFLNVAKANTQNSSCAVHVLCKNKKDYSCSRILHEHLFTLGFMPNYICLTKHGERGVIMEEDKEEDGDDDNIIIHGFAEYGAFDDTAMGEAEEEVRQKMSPLMILVRPSVMHREKVKVTRRRSSSSAC